MLQEFSMDNQEFIRNIRLLKCLFDEGITIEAGDEGFSIIGYDYLNEEDDMRILRTYFVPFTTDDADNYYDTLESVLVQIKADTLKLSSLGS